MNTKQQPTIEQKRKVLITYFLLESIFAETNNSAKLNSSVSRQIYFDTAKTINAYYAILQKSELNRNPRQDTLCRSSGKIPTK